MRQVFSEADGAAAIRGLVAQKKPVAEIARVLGLSRKTVYVGLAECV
jgi:DNA-binding phage protein